MTDFSTTKQTGKNKMEKFTEIDVDGKATVVAIPDTISLLIRITAKAPEYLMAVQKLNEESKAVSVVLAACGVAKVAQTREYAVEEEWANQYEAEKRRLIGYSGVQQLVVEFPIDTEKLCKVLQGLGSMATCPTVDTYFEVKDQREMFQLARRNALQAATDTASDLAAQMGLKIVGVKSMKHSMTKDPSPHSLHVAFDGAMTANATFSMPDIVPEEVSHSAYFSGVWLAISVDEA